MIKAIMSLFLCILGLLPAVIITAIAFVINPIFGVIVALYFIGAPEPGQEVDHIDGNTSNNSYSNLQWVYHRDNMKRKSKAYGEAL